MFSNLCKPSFSIIMSTVNIFMIFTRDEGIVLKDYGSKWDPGDRSGKWLKLKPDYIHAGSDLDVLIIGGWHFISNLYDLDIERSFSSIYLVRIVEVLTFLIFFAGGYFGSGRQGGEVSHLCNY